MSLFAWIYVLC